MAYRGAKKSGRERGLTNASAWVTRQTKANDIVQRYLLTKHPQTWMLSVLEAFHAFSFIHSIPPSITHSLPSIEHVLGTMTDNQNIMVTETQGG